MQCLNDVSYCGQCISGNPLAVVAIFTGDFASLTKRIRSMLATKSFRDTGWSQLCIWKLTRLELACFRGWFFWVATGSLASCRLLTKNGVGTRKANGCFAQKKRRNALHNTRNDEYITCDREIILKVSARFQFSLKESNWNWIFSLNNHLNNYFDMFFWMIIILKYFKQRGLMNRVFLTIHENVNLI